MNAEERKKLKRAVESRVAWKKKAQGRQKETRLLKLRIRDLERSRKHWKEKFFQAKADTETKRQKRRHPSIPRKQRPNKKKIDFDLPETNFGLLGFLSIDTSDSRLFSI